MTKEEIKTLENELRKCRQDVFSDDEAIAEAAQERIYEIKALLQLVYDRQWASSMSNRSYLDIC